MPIVITHRTPESLTKHGNNYLLEWKPDSNMLVVAVRINNNKLLITGIIRILIIDAFNFYFFLSWVLFLDNRRNIAAVYAVGGGYSKRDLQSNRSSVQKSLP